MLELDRLGVPAVAVFSDEFESAYEAWTTLHGFRAASVFVAHPIQPLNDEEVVERADSVFTDLLAALTTSG